MKNEKFSSTEPQASRDSQGNQETANIVPQASKDLQGTQEIEEKKKTAFTRKRNIKDLEGLVNKVKVVGEMVRNPTINTQNEFEVFGKSIAAQLNAMPFTLALKAQCHIQNYLSTFRLQAMAHTSNLDYSPCSPSNTIYISTPTPSPTDNNATTKPKFNDSVQETLLMNTSNDELCELQGDDISLLMNTRNDEFGQLQGDDILQTSNEGQLQSDDILKLAIKSIRTK